LRAKRTSSALAAEVASRCIRRNSAILSWYQYNPPTNHITLTFRRHITHGDVVQAKNDLPPTSTGVSKFNLDSTAQKAPEVEADSFAAHAIAEGKREKGSDRGLAATQVATTLTELSWNLTGHRSLDNFGGSVLHEPPPFYSAGLSHPNLEWRARSQ
jgi:hypothetical protein